MKRTINIKSLWVVAVVAMLALASCVAHDGPDDEPTTPPEVENPSEETPGEDNPGGETPEETPKYDYLEAYLSSGFCPQFHTKPFFVNPEGTEDVLVVLNVEGYGIDEGEAMYAHTGLLTDKSTGDSDWKYVKHDWEVNAEDCRLTHQSGTVYTLTLKGGLRAFYGVAAEDKITHMMFVFRSADGNKRVGPGFVSDLDFKWAVCGEEAVAAQILAPCLNESVTADKPCKVMVVTQNTPDGAVLYTQGVDWTDSENPVTVITKLADLDEGLNLFDYTFTIDDENVWYENISLSCALSVDHFPMFSITVGVQRDVD